MIYLDNAASTPVHPQVLDEMVPYLREQHGNPSSLHGYGRAAERALKLARRQISAIIHAQPGQILLTSGGTESNNTALFGAPGGAKKIITTAIEHESVLEPCRRLAGLGHTISYIRPDGAGIISPCDVADAISEDTLLVSVMLANNEVGTIQPVAEVARICHERGVLLHTDATQAVGKIPVDVSELGADMLSMSSHKINGPKGAGALYVRSGIRLEPLLLGGGQERGLRSGTENVAGLVGFGKACELALGGLEQNAASTRSLRDKLVSGVLSEIPHSAYNGDADSRLPGNAHFTFLGVSGEDLIIKLDECGIAASTGSACSVKTQKESHVLRAMGFSREQIAGSLRISLGIFNTADEIDRTVSVLADVVSDLRRVSPFRAKYGF